MATIGLDGHFRELNQAFSDLVGHSEAEFTAATWPPVMDRANLSKHREQMEQLLAGLIDSARGQHGLRARPGPAGAGRRHASRSCAGTSEPDHFLLDVNG